ncbi:hypothetical protein V5S96_11050 [Corynebacterium mastitidis]|uniref:Peroxide stress protein YaaA n=1 Tax=Corynebacterium mastitidis TaxID=161890 RepID=A0ABU8P1I6_9CORY
MTVFRLTLTGTKPVLLHNAQLSDPMNRWAREMKAISAKRKKTDEDHIELARLEFMGSLYYDADLGPVLPAQNIKAALIAGAKKLKLGKVVQSDLQLTDQVTPLAYKGPRDLEGLWGDGESAFVNRASVKVGMSRVMRTRPMFASWAAEVEGFFDETSLNLADVQQVLEYAGRAGIGDWRPEFGTFTAQIEVK